MKKKNVKVTCSLINSSVVLKSSFIVQCSILIKVKIVCEQRVIICPLMQDLLGTKKKFSFKIRGTWFINLNAYSECLRQTRPEKGSPLWVKTWLLEQRRSLLCSTWETQQRLVLMVISLYVPFYQTDKSAHLLIKPLDPAPLSACALLLRWDVTLTTMIYIARPCALCITCLSLYSHSPSRWYAVF